MVPIWKLCAQIGMECFSIDSQVKWWIRGRKGLNQLLARYFSSFIEFLKMLVRDVEKSSKSVEVLSKFLRYTLIGLVVKVMRYCCPGFHRNRSDLNFKSKGRNLSVPGPGIFFFHS